MHVRSIASVESLYALYYLVLTDDQFNPLLGETFECIREDRGFRFISEKVSHHPAVMACYAQGSDWTFSQDSSVKSKFWGKSMEFVPSGSGMTCLYGFEFDFW